MCSRCTMQCLVIRLSDQTIRGRVRVPNSTCKKVEWRRRLSFMCHVRLVLSGLTLCRARQTKLLNIAHFAAYLRDCPPCTNVHRLASYKLLCDVKLSAKLRRTSTKKKKFNLDERRSESRHIFFNEQNRFPEREKNLQLDTAPRRGGPICRALGTAVTSISNWLHDEC